MAKNLFSKLLRTVVNIAALPVEVVKDAVTLGGAATKGEVRPYTKDRIEKLIDDVED